MPLSNRNSVAARLQAMADEGRSSARTVSHQLAPADYGQLSQQLAALISGEKDRVANLANCAALLCTLLSGHPIQCVSKRDFHFLKIKKWIQKTI